LCSPILRRSQPTFQRSGQHQQSVCALQIQPGARRFECGPAASNSTRACLRFPCCCRASVRSRHARAVFVGHSCFATVICRAAASRPRWRADPWRAAPPPSRAAARAGRAYLAAIPNSSAAAASAVSTSPLASAITTWAGSNRPRARRSQACSATATAIEVAAPQRHRGRAGPGPCPGVPCIPSGRLGSTPPRRPPGRLYATGSHPSRRAPDPHASCP
jgi:hypothetical protein